MGSRKRRLHAPDHKHEGEPLCTQTQSKPVAKPGELIDCTLCISKLNSCIWYTNELTRAGYIIGTLPDPKPKKPQAPKPGSAAARTLNLGDWLS